MYEPRREGRVIVAVAGVGQKPIAAVTLIGGLREPFNLWPITRNGGEEGERGIGEVGAKRFGEFLEAVESRGKTS